LISAEERNHMHRFFLKDPYTYLFHLADLDERYAEDIRWFVRKRGQEISTLALLFQKPELPVFQLLEQGNPDSVSLVEEILPQLPAKIYCQISSGPAEALGKHYQTESKIRFLKMRWPKTGKKSFEYPDQSPLIRLNLEHEKAIREFVPAVWFDLQMLKDGYYYGVFDQGQLVSMGGSSLFSKKYGVAVIGSVGTRESHLRRGYCARIISQLNRDLVEQVSFIGLNVRADNEPAIQCYLKCGFEMLSEFWECRFTK
jgi:RimJ/RimL family protein N-acetyltransferase